MLFLLADYKSQFISESVTAVAIFSAEAIFSFSLLFIGAPLNINPSWFSKLLIKLDITL